MDYFAFQFHITDNCDQRCKHCYIFSENNNILLKQMSREKMYLAFNNCLVMCKKVNRIPYFYITGGDPILHPQFWELLSLFKKHEMKFTILGNPFHLNAESCKRLKDHGCERYQLSIDGMAKTHDFFRKPGSFITTLNKIKTLHDAGIRCAIMTTVSGINANEIPQIIDTVVEYKADVFAFARYCPTGNERTNNLTPEKYKELLTSCWQKFEEYKYSETTFNLKDHLWKLFLHEKGLFEIPQDLDEEIIYDGCHCADSHISILPNGDVYACRRMQSNIGNIFKESLYDIFTGKNMDVYRDYNKFEKCSTCELKRFCRGCPSVAYGYTGNFYSPDPQCWRKEL